MQYQAIVIIIKRYSGSEMRYGVYNTFFEAAEAVKHIKSVNTIDDVVIEERYLNVD